MDGVKRKPILCLDFDGVCSTYKSGWQGADVINDPHVAGLFEFLDTVAPHFDIHVFSSRSNQPGGIEAMQTWFFHERRKWRQDGGQGETIIDISFPKEKPPAFVTIDDRAIRFDGLWPDLSTLLNFKPWNKR